MSNQDKEKTIKKITEVLNARGDRLEEAANKIAPDFDYEKAQAELMMEEGSHAPMEASPAPQEATPAPDEASLPPAEVSSSKYPKERKAYKSWFGRTFLSNIHGKVIGITILVAILTALWGVFYWIPNAPAREISSLIIETARETGIQSASETKEEVVKAESLVILDPKIDSGVQETTKGEDGKGEFTYTYYTICGKNIGTKKELNKWIKEPVDNVLHLGTKRTGHTGTYKVTGTFTANCSAYWMGNNCRGASGGRCVYGTVAVDRFKYPYGTMFWIEGYGFAVANDCGTSIKGDKLDLWMDSFDESCRWGRRHMTTYILEERK